MASALCLPHSHRASIGLYRIDCIEALLELIGRIDRLNRLARIGFTDVFDCVDLNRNDRYDNR